MHTLANNGSMSIGRTNAERGSDCEVPCECTPLAAPASVGDNHCSGPGYWRLPLPELPAETDQSNTGEDVSSGPVPEQRELVVEEEETAQLELESLPPQADPRISNLGHFRCSSKDFESVVSSNFTVIKKVSPGNNGDIFQYRWRQGQQESHVAVKKLRNRALKHHEDAERDEWYIHKHPGKFVTLNTEDALAEIGVLTYLSKQRDVPSYLLKMHAVFADNLFTWLVTEFAEGGELFDVAASGMAGETEIKKYVWQITQACDYLHRHSIGHRDISLENVLLKDGDVRLMDFGMAVRSHSTIGTPLRFFREVGKSFYRSPECYVPTHGEVEVVAPMESQPGNVIMAKVDCNFLCEVRLQDNMVPGQTCAADVWGYGALPSDVFSIGVCMFILSFRTPAWECARLSNRFFAHYYNSEGDKLDAIRLFLRKPNVLSHEAMHMLSEMLQLDPQKRPSASTCLAHPWFAEVKKQ